MEKMKKISALLLALMMLMSLCACGSSNSKGQAPVSEAAYSSYGDYDYEAAEEAYAPMPTPMPVYDGENGLAVSAAAPAAGAKNESTGSDSAAENSEKIIYSSEVTVETTAFDETVGKISGLVASYDGWIEASSVSGSNYAQKARGNAPTRDASYTLRIPSNRFQALMENLSDLGNIPYSHIYTENVTSQYVDSQARLKAYQTQEERLLEMMELAESVEDVIIIEDRLTELRYQIESIQSRLNNWDRRVSYSTISLTIREVREYTPEVRVDPSYGEELMQALKDGLENAGEFLKNLLVFLVEVLPVLLILVPLAWFVIWLIRKAWNSGRARREAGKEKSLSRKARRAEEKARKAEARALKAAEAAAVPAERGTSAEQPKGEKAQEGKETEEI